MHSTLKCYLCQVTRNFSAHLMGGPQAVAAAVEPYLGEKPLAQGPIPPQRFTQHSPSNLSINS